MRLQRLELDFFGHFTGKALDFGTRLTGQSDFHLIYGENEAGKTTLMEGYLRLLYGFRAREAYAFKHNRANLKVSATLQMSDGCREFTRLPTRTNNLLGADGQPVPEAALQSALSNLSIDDYRKLLCLDDATIEDGGEEIANSEGDIGRLLFSAAAGVSDLSKVLNDLENRYGALYRKGSSKSAFATQKHALDEINKQIRATDIGASEYQERKRNLEGTSASEQGVRAQRRDTLAKQKRLQSTADALPISAEIADLERKLAPLSHYPTMLDFNPEMLIDLTKQNVALNAEREALAEGIDEKVRLLEAIDPHDGLVPAMGQLRDLKELRDRCGSAAFDLPRRHQQVNEVVEDMQSKLGEIGMGRTENPELLVLESAVLVDLETKFQTVSHAQNALTNARSEETLASDRLSVARKASEKVSEPETDAPDLQNFLVARNAHRVVEDVNRVEEALRMARRAAHESIAKLSLNETDFRAIPALPINSETALRMSRNMQSADEAVTQAEATFAEAKGEIARRETRLAALESAGNLVDDDDAAETRYARDQLWLAHREHLSDQTAENFEAAMRIDDAKMSVRQSQATLLAEYRHEKIALADDEIKGQSAEAALEVAKARRADLENKRRAHLLSVGLDEDLDETAFAEWVRNAEEARALVQKEDFEQKEAQPALERAAMLKRDLAGVLDQPGSDLGALVAMAHAVASKQEKGRIEREAVQSALHDSREAHQNRVSETEACQNSLESAKSLWLAALDNSIGKTGRDLLFPQAFETFRTLRELNEQLLGLRRQIDGMDRDQQALTTALHPLVQDQPEYADMEIVSAFDALLEAAESAARAHDDRRKLSHDIAEERQKSQSVAEGIARIADQRRQLAAPFDPSISTGTLDALRKAVGQAQTAIDLREEIDTASRRLCLLLNVGTRADAEAALKGLALTDVQAALAECGRDLEALEMDLTKAIEHRANAEAALDAISGEADVAVLVSKRQTTELEMESSLIRHLELKIGHMLANAAILRYRDTHRSAMMLAAEAAFVELTNGSYSGLTVQPSGAKDVLVAIQSSDGASKQASALSKGTRFQLYLALRAAAYEQLAANGTTLPFFCDDVFETFDEGRTRAACGLMHRIGKTGQAVYLTHHKHVVDIAQEVCGKDVQVHTL